MKRIERPNWQTCKHISDSVMQARGATVARVSQLATEVRLLADQASGNAILAGPLLLQVRNDDSRDMDIHFRGEWKDISSMSSYLVELQHQLAARPDLGDSVIYGLTHRDLALPASRVLGVVAEEADMSEVSETLRKNILQIGNVARRACGRPCMPDNAPLYRLSISTDAFLSRNFIDHIPVRSVEHASVYNSYRKGLAWVGYASDSQAAVALSAAVAVASKLTMSNGGKGEASDDKTRSEADKYNNNTRREATRNYTQQTSKF